MSVEQNGRHYRTFLILQPRISRYVCVVQDFYKEYLCQAHTIEITLQNICHNILLLKKYIFRSNTFKKKPKYFISGEPKIPQYLIHKNHRVFINLHKDVVRKVWSGRKGAGRGTKDVGNDARGIW